jgi:hypothetical protein
VAKILDSTLIIIYNLYSVKIEREVTHGFLKVMSDKLLNRKAREGRKENLLNFVILAFFAVNFVRAASIVLL